MTIAAQLDAVKKENLLCDPTSCPLGTRHAPNGLEWGIGCGLCKGGAGAAGESKSN